MFETLQGRLGVAFETLLKFDLTHYWPTIAPKPHLNVAIVAFLSSFPPYLSAESSLLLTKQRHGKGNPNVQPIQAG